MVSFKFLRNWAREEGVIGFSRMSKAGLEELWEESQPETARKKGIISRKRVPVLNSFAKKVLPKNIPAIIETSVKKAIDRVERLKNKKEFLKERAREKLLKLNAKIGELLKKPEFEITEKPGLAGRKFTVLEKNVIQQKVS